ncbi:MAG: UDP-N-acetylmuramate--L-alanine ligase [Bacteroidetes bacterium]|nr:UDP-N-acetylmuramate--L-alanine ligase [Bacteroidota bacterium]
MNFGKQHIIYFLGIGGIGMSAIARYFHSKAAVIYGYDKTKTPLTEQLIKEGMQIHFEENINEIPENIDFVVYTPAIPKMHKELQYFQKKAFNIYKRSEVLGMITRDAKSIGVAGTHGKTTISTMTAHLLKQSAIDCSAFLGGISKNYNSNLLLSEKSDYIVVEADEFDRSFLQLHPYIAVVSSIDADHLDIYGDKNELKKSFEVFISQIQKGGKLIVKKGLQLIMPDNIDIYTYSLNENADFHAANITIKNGYYYFDYIFPDGIFKEIKMGYPGLHNIENAVAAISVAVLSGVKENEIRPALAAFEGVSRRFDFRIRTEKLVYIDDYAHHPEELKACIYSVRNLFPDKKICGIFQPHLFSRTRDFADEFARSLELLDEVVLLDIYPARELPIPGITSQFILDKIINTEKHLVEKSEIINFLKNRDIEVLLTLGAGDIDQLVEPIEKMLLS